MIDNKKMCEILGAMAEKVQEQKDFLTELDNEIGDGDHGINLARGFAAVKEKMPSFADKDVGAILKVTGMTLVSTVGGASGPLYGTAFMKAGMACKGMAEIGGKEFLAAFSAAVAGIKQRGKSEEGEKTMLDALCPAERALTEALGGGADLKEALGKAVDAAEEGLVHTKDIIATKGRASYLGERSLGHQDPGATSSLLLLQVFEATL
ncbi:dihydroxyacetone kinase subunit DhaL [Selenomonas sp. AB3002]|uniref:dihydroxyacetone kinase subunit DhaL n=1 Tax=Selenomonas sp. AB3002 TaxID=1392502 RepID=UPI000497A79A